MSQEYLASIVLLVGAVLKLLGIELESGALEGLIGGALALWIAVRRKAKGDINVLGMRKA